MKQKGGLKLLNAFCDFNTTNQESISTSTEIRSTPYINGNVQFAIFGANGISKLTRMLNLSGIRNRIQISAICKHWKQKSDLRVTLFALLGRIVKGSKMALGHVLLHFEIFALWSQWESNVISKFRFKCKVRIKLFYMTSF